MLQTGTLLKAVVHRETGIRASQVMSHVAILDVPRYHKLLFITDGGMVVAPNLEQKGHILKNAVDFCRFLGYERPKAAALCAVETVNPAMPETGDALSLKEAGERGEFGPCIVEGPISLDLATDREAALVKGYHSPVAGDADILLVPAIAVGNVLGKALYGLGRRPDGRSRAGSGGPYHHQFPWGHAGGEILLYPALRRHGLGGS